MSRITIECPDDFLAMLGMTPSQFAREAQFVLAAKLYEVGRLSSGKAARLAGMGRVDFLLELPRIGVPGSNLTPEDLEDDLHYARGS